MAVLDNKKTRVNTMLQLLINDKYKTEKKIS